MFADLAAAVAGGADCIDGVGQTCGDREHIFDPAASTTTMWRLVDSRVDATHLPGIRAARAHAREQAWAAGAAPEPGQWLILDVDATITIDHSDDKEKAAPTWKKTFGHHPLLVFLDRQQSLSVRTGAARRRGEMGRMEGRVAFVTGAARGQGRSHAIRLTQEGAAIVAVDICDQISAVPYPMSTRADLDETVNLVEKDGGSILAITADVRDESALRAAFASGVQQFGHVDTVLANAGVILTRLDEPDPKTAWEVGIGVMLTGVWNTIQVAYPHMIECGQVAPSCSPVRWPVSAPSPTEPPDRMPTPSQR